MPAAFDALSPATFAGVTFAWDDIYIVGIERHHQHEYPHTPGAAIEKLGRKPYEIRFQAVFDENISKQWPARYPNLYPDALTALRKLYEAETTDTLFVPTLGSIQALMINYSQRATPQVRSGERGDFVFVEDMTSGFTVAKLAQRQVRDLANLNQVVQTFQRKAVEQDSAFKTFMKQLDAAVTLATGLLDTEIGKAQNRVEAVNQTAVGACARVSDYCSLIDRTSQTLQHPENWQVVRALHNLQASSNSLSANAMSTLPPPLYVYTPRRAMSVQQISTALYGNTTRTFELLQRNSFRTPYAVPANTQVLYAS